MKKRVYSGAPWEKEVAYCRAVRFGSIVVVSGTTAVNEAGEVVGDNLYTQTSFIFKKIKSALNELDVSMENVVRTRSFVTSIDQFDDFARAHREVFSGIDPAASCIQVSALVDPRLLIEIEVDAVIEEEKHVSGESNEDYS